MKRCKYCYKLYILKNNLIKCIIFLFLFLVFVFLVFINTFNINNDFELETDEIYLAIGESYLIDVNENHLNYSSLNTDIATIKDGVITGVSNGTTVISVRKFGNKKTIRVSVSDLYTIDILDNNKEFLSCHEYTEKENIFLDKVLEYKIKKVGYKTRAAAVEAARFLSLEFKYRIHYFYENGRLLTNGTRSYVDGEGRYYHKGLYLSDSKFDEIVKSEYGPKIWGCSLYTKILKTSTPNGLDCSGFVSWVLFNAGFDIGDAGAGISKKKTNDLDDLGRKIIINNESLNEVKVGDLVSRDGHIGILIGKDKDKFYVAESLDYDLHVLTLSKKDFIDSDWLYFIDLDNIYIEDGNLSNMW